MYVPADHHADVFFHVRCPECGVDSLAVFGSQYEAQEEASLHNAKHRVAHTCTYQERHGWVGQDDCLACQREANIAASRRPA